MKKNILFALFFFLNLNLILNLVSCSTTDPKLEPDLKLELKDVSCTEAWLQLTTNNIQIPVTINLLKNNTVTQTFSLSTQESLLYIDSLLPNQNYSFQVSSIQNPASSNKVTATTLDTTSHNFTFETFTFGEHSSSALYDVAIINENDIWAVGEIYMNDSLGNPDPKFYNLIKWDGAEWKPERIYFTNSQGQSFLAPMKSIFAFSENDIWIGLDQLIHWDGIDYIEYELSDVIFQSWVNKIWGTSSEDLYVVGNDGNIAHYGGSSVGWQRIESGTTLNINDIWGDYNEKTQEWEILAVASNVNTSFERAIIKIENNTPKTISNIPIQWSLKTCWFIPMRKYYVAGSGVYEKHTLIQNQWSNEPLDITTYYTNRIRGNSINDVLGVGAFGDLVHFNGWQWKIDYTQPNLNFGSYLSVDFKNNIFVAVGLEYNQAVILKGIR